MTTVFEVSSIFKLIDQASPQLKQMLGSVENLDRAIIATQKSLSALGRTGFSAISGKLGALTTEVGLLDRAAIATQASLNRIGSRTAGLTGLNGKLDTVEKKLVQVNAATSAITLAPLIDSTDIAITRASALASEWRTIAAEAGKAAASAGAMAGGSGVAAAAGASAIPVSSRNPKRHGPQQSGVHISSASAGVPMPGGGHGHVRLAGTGTPSLLAVGAGLYGVEQMMKDAMEPMHEEAKLKNLNIGGVPASASAIEEIKKRARQIATDVPGSGYAQNLDKIGSTYSIVGLEGSMMIAQKLAEFDRQSEIIAGKHGGTAHKTASMDITRAAELMGKLTDEKTGLPDMNKFGRLMDVLGRLQAATEGRVNPHEILNAAQQGGPALANLSDEGMYGLGVVTQATKGNRAGTGFAAISRQFQGGIMTADKAAQLEKLEIAKAGDFTFGPRGKVKANPGAMAGFVEQLQKDAVGAVRDTLLPALHKHGFNTNEQIVPQLYKFLGTAPEVRLIYEMARNTHQIEGEIGRTKLANAPEDAVKNFQTNDPTASMSAFTTAFKDLLGALGSPLVTASIPGMNAMTGAFNKASEVAGAHPTSTGIISSALAGAALGGATGLAYSWWTGPGAAWGTLGGAAVGGALGAASGIAGAITDYTHASPPGTPKDAIPNSGAGFGGIWKWLFPESTAKDAAAVKTSFNDVTGAMQPTGTALEGVAKIASALPGPLDAVATAMRSIQSAAQSVPAVSVPQTASAGVGGSAPSGRSMSVEPYLGGSDKVIQVSHVINMDGRKVAEGVSEHRVRAMSGPSEGSPFFDSTRGTEPMDFALS